MGLIYDISLVSNLIKFNICSKHRCSYFVKIIIDFCFLMYVIETLSIIFNISPFQDDKHILEQCVFQTDVFSMTLLNASYFPYIPL